MTIKRREPPAKKKRKIKPPKEGWSKHNRRNRSKGHEFEKVVARRLTKAITGKEKPEIFWRSATSGGRATTANKRGEKGVMHGDIMAIDKIGQWFTDNIVVECKNVRKLDYTLILEERGEVWKWWQKLTSHASRIGKMPLLIMKQTNSATYAVFDLKDINCFSDQKKRKRMAFVDMPKQSNMVLCFFDDLLNCMSKYEIERRFEELAPGD